MSSQDKFDGVLLAMAQQHEGIESLLHTFFSFLERKTDFFTAASPQAVETVVLKVLKDHQGIAAQKAAAKAASKPAAATPAPRPTLKADEPKIMEIDENDDLSTDKGKKPADVPQPVAEEPKGRLDKREFTRQGVGLRLIYSLLILLFYAQSTALRKRAKATSSSLGPATEAGQTSTSGRRRYLYALYIKCLYGLKALACCIFEWVVCPLAHYVIFMVYEHRLCLAGFGGQGAFGHQLCPQDERPSC